MHPMATERSITPGRKAAPKNYRLPEELFVAVSAMSDLFHAGTIIRVGEDAVAEQLIELGFLPSTKKAAVMPTAETVTTKEAVAASLEDIRELLESMHSRLKSTMRARFILRASTNKQLATAFARWPNVADIVIPRPVKESHELLPLKLFVHPRTQIALDEYVEALRGQYPDASLSMAIHLSIRRKCTLVGLDPLELWRTGKPFLRPTFTRLPHPDVTYETRSFEERAIAIHMALKVLGDATVAHGLDALVLPTPLQDTIERFFGAVALTTLEE